jgi:phage/plasmid-associated DNA primase
MILKIASASDILIARGHCQNETDFTTRFLPVVLTNDIPNIKPYDDAVDSRVHVISYIQ